MDGVFMTYSLALIEKLLKFLFLKSLMTTGCRDFPVGVVPLFQAAVG